MRKTYSSRIPLITHVITPTHMRTHQIEYSQLIVILNRRFHIICFTVGTASLCVCVLCTDICISSLVDGVTEAQLAGLAENIIGVDVAD